jgi:uncharacterized protein YihD (DUF1040 family)
VRDPNRIPKMLDVIRRAWEMHPDYRLGQLLSNAVADSDLFHVEDDRLAALVLSHALAMQALVRK